MGEELSRIGVVGGGLMGSGIVEVVARAGMDVVCVEVSKEAAERAQARIASSIDRARERGRLSATEADAALQRISMSDTIDSLADRDFVIEAASEDETIKSELFRRLGDIVESDDAILASNTSSIPVVKLGAVSGRPGHVIGVHFFNPVPVMPLVELIPSLTTTPETLERSRSFTEQTLGKQIIEATDRAGFVVNSLLVPYLLSAIRMFEAGYASADDIDRGMVLGCGHPMGPLALADLIGLDTVRSIGHSMYEEHKEPLYSPPPLLDRMVEAGLLGKKTGHGFHRYEKAM